MDFVDYSRRFHRRLSHEILEAAPAELPPSPKPDRELTKPCTALIEDQWVTQQAV